MESGRLKKALERFGKVRDQLLEKQRQEARFLQRCGDLLHELRAAGNLPEVVEASETLGELSIFRHTDGDENRIELVFSPQRDRAIINERYLEHDAKSVRREGSDLLLALDSLADKIDPNRCLIYQLLKPVEIFAVVYAKDATEPKSFIANRFGLVTSKRHMKDFITRLSEAPENPPHPLPPREELPEFIEDHLEDTLAASLEERLGHLEEMLQK